MIIKIDFHEKKEEMSKLSLEITSYFIFNNL